MHLIDCKFHLSAPKAPIPFSTSILYEFHVIDWLILKPHYCNLWSQQWVFIWMEFVIVSHKLSRKHRYIFFRPMKVRQLSGDGKVSQLHSSSEHYSSDWVPQCQGLSLSALLTCTGRDSCCSGELYSNLTSIIIHIWQMRRLRHRFWKVFRLLTSRRSGPNWFVHGHAGSLLQRIEARSLEPQFSALTTRLPCLLWTPSLGQHIFKRWEKHFTNHSREMCDLPLPCA